MTTDAMVRSDIESGPVDVLRPTARWSAGPVHWARDPLAPTSVAKTLDIVVGLARRRFGADGAGDLVGR